MKHDSVYVKKQKNPKTKKQKHAILALEGMERVKEKEGKHHEVSASECAAPRPGRRLVLSLKNQNEVFFQKHIMILNRVLRQCRASYTPSRERAPKS